MAFAGVGVDKLPLAKLPLRFLLRMRRDLKEQGKEDEFAFLSEHISSRVAAGERPSTLAQIAAREAARQAARDRERKG